LAQMSVSVMIRFEFRAQDHHHHHRHHHACCLSIVPANVVAPTSSSSRLCSWGNSISWIYCVPVLSLLQYLLQYLLSLPRSRFQLSLYSKLVETSMHYISQSCNLHILWMCISRCPATIAEHLYEAAEMLQQLHCVTSTNSWIRAVDMCLCMTKNERERERMRERERCMYSNALIQCLL
jgi:hypothetical protein